MAEYGREFCPGVICLFETQFGGVRVNGIISKLGFPNSFNLDVVTFNFFCLIMVSVTWGSVGPGLSGPAHPWSNRRMLAMFPFKRPTFELKENVH